MIIPSKHLSQDRALLTVGALILQKLGQPRTVSSLWDELTRHVDGTRYSPLQLSYDQFVLALDLLFLMHAIDLSDGLLKRNAR